MKHAQYTHPAGSTTAVDAPPRNGSTKYPENDCLGPTKLSPGPCRLSCCEPGPREGPSSCESWSTRRNRSRRNCTRTRFFCIGAGDPVNQPQHLLLRKGNAGERPARPLDQVLLTSTIVFLRAVGAARKSYVAFHDYYCCLTLRAEILPAIMMMLCLVLCTCSPLAFFL